MPQTRRKLDLARGIRAQPQMQFGERFVGLTIQSTAGPTPASAISRFRVVNGIARQTVSVLAKRKRRSTSEWTNACYVSAVPRGWWAAIATLATAA